MGLFRLSIVGELTGPDLFQLISLLGKETSLKRIALLEDSFEQFRSLKHSLKKLSFDANFSYLIG